MKYLGLAYYSPDAFAAMTPEAVEALVSQCPALDAKMQATGRMLVSASLGEPHARKTLRPRGGKAQVSDGPYSEAKEVVGGVFVIEADSEEEALAMANDSEYGLASYVFTRDSARVVRVMEGLEFGMVGINQGVVSNPSAPFGGVKHSGFGREGGFEGIEEYLETKYVGLAL